MDEEELFARLARPFVSPMLCNCGVCCQAGSVSLAVFYKDPETTLMLISVESRNEHAVPRTNLDFRGPLDRSEARRLQTYRPTY